jgi:hypothetical protein
LLASIISLQMMRERGNELFSLHCVVLDDLKDWKI